jgi:hypothetical protein
LCCFALLMLYACVLFLTHFFKSMASGLMMVSCKLQSSQPQPLSLQPPDWLFHSRKLPEHVCS